MRALELFSCAGGHAGARLLAWPWDRPATTVTTTAAIGAPGRRSPGHGVPKGSQGGVGSVRKLSERARAILQGFPDGWEFVGRTQKSRAGQIEMAMPPPLAEDVALAIRNWFAKYSQDGG